ncbi:hypothetical protein CBLAS_1216 [Campylobacter blaseri]|uniref:Uncharacterized protein n=1 Tax=Campylobacter blaseri TaxID=2042961 RepID=A0A2P8QZW6_9BACT|nr:hypothetical protein [Campylobacter blaseri]PSM51786.1 hypothetical protein CQ405_06570 [Campylobacter blaseri]PSM53577.1 hypothetical protein CRN67_06575 [Campylobacter blaseri]QKF86388.1 hypothetical protein CBLAS_1216 [Campylobacter blaseri]
MKKILLLLNILFVNLIANSMSCYDYYNIKKEQEIKSAVFVLIDETTLFNEALQNQVLANSLKFVKYGNHIFIAKFSSFLDGKYNEVLFEMNIDTPLSKEEKYNIRKDLLVKVDKCLKDQIGYVRNMIKKSISGAFLKDGDSIAKSDIFYALQDFGNYVIAPMKIEDKVVILASDMLENSSITSFYVRGLPRLLNNKKELNLLEKNDLFGNFGGAKIYVIGTGLTESKKGYIKPQVLKSLNSFWVEYFNRSNAKLIELGTPALKHGIK